MKFLKTVICWTFVALSISAESKLSIIGPTTLADQFNDDLPFSIGHYGAVPYGAHLVGRLVLVEPINGCGNVESFTNGEDVMSGSLIAVVRRGGCLMSSKARNAQFAGAKLLIIVDLEKEELVDGFGRETLSEDIKIPTIMIQKEPGEKIITYLEANKPSPDGDEDEDEDSSGMAPIVSVNFPYDPQTDKARIDFWYSSVDSKGTSHLFLDRFFDYWDKNTESILFVPHVITWTCIRCKKEGFVEQNDPDCISGGRYCAPDPDATGPLTGTDVLLEDIRQLCMASYSPAKWWKYMIEFGEKCGGSPTMKQCGTDILESLFTGSFDREAISNCQKMSFTSSGGTVNEKLDDNNVLREQRILQTEYNINDFPMLFINHKVYSGQLHHTFRVFEEVCKNVKNPSSDCKNALKYSSALDFEQPSEDHTGRVIFVIIMMFVLSFMVFYCCKRMIKKESKDMSMQVGGMVTRYFALKDESKEENTNES